MSAVWWFLYGQTLVLLFAITLGYGLLKTHIKGVQSANRLNNLAPVAKAANTAQATATTANTNATTANTNATTAISRLNAIGSASNMGTEGTFATFGGATDGTTLKANINATVGYCNDIVGFVNDAAARLNSIYSSAG